MITNAEKRILLCDRDELRARRLALLLSKTSKDWNVLTIFEVKDWVEVLREGNFDTILLQEKGLSEKDGLTLLREIRERNREVPVILLSEEPNLENALKAFHLGIFDYLRDSCSEEEIRAVLHLALESHELKNQKERLLQDLIETNSRLTLVPSRSFFKMNHLLSRCLSLAMDFFDANKGVALLHDPNTHSLVVKASSGFNGHFKEGTTFVIQGHPDLEKVVFQGKTCLLTSVDGRLVSSPLGVPPDVFGILCLGRPRSFAEGDLKILSIFSPLIPYALGGNQLFDELEATRNGGVHSLLLLMEEKDPLLWMHANRVMEYACSLARTIIGIQEETIHSIRLAALLHEVGKITEPSPLQERVQRMTSRVIEPLRLPEETKVILQRQAERYEGKGEGIPIGSRILAIADAFDEALSQGKSQEEGLSSLISHAGSQFDPVMVEHFRQLFSRTLFDSTTEPLHSHP